MWTTPGRAVHSCARKVAEHFAQGPRFLACRQAADVATRGPDEVVEGDQRVDTGAADGAAETQGVCGRDGQVLVPVLVAGLHAAAVGDERQGEHTQIADADAV